MRILITGACSGIGFDLARELPSRNHVVYITVHTKEQLKEVKKKVKDIKLNILCFKMDIRNKTEKYYRH